MKKSYTLKLEGKEWKDCLKESYNKKKKDIKIDGFRKGQVPYDIYVKKTGVETLFMDAIDMAVDILYAKLLSDPQTITPAATPSIDIKDISDKLVEIVSIVRGEKTNNSVSLKTPVKELNINVNSEIESAINESIKDFKATLFIDNLVMNSSNKDYEINKIELDLGK